MPLGPNLVVDYDFEADDPAWIFSGTGIRTNTPFGSLNGYYARGEGAGPPAAFLAQDMSGLCFTGVLYQIDAIIEEDIGRALIINLGSNEIYTTGDDPLPLQAMFVTNLSFSFRVAGASGGFVGIDELQIREVLPDVPVKTIHYNRLKEA